MSDERRRRGDSISISGDYQFKAITEGSSFQRAWHREKLFLFERRFPVDPTHRGLDVGCGSGVVTSALSDQGCEMVGVDGNLDAIQFAKNQFGGTRCSFEHGLVDEIDFGDQKFDFAISLEVIEHLYMEQGDDLVTSMKRTLKRNGRICLTTPNYKGTWPLIEKAMDRFSSLPNLEEDQHVSHYNSNILSGLLHRHGFKNIEVGTFSTFSPVCGIISPRFQSIVSRFEERINIPFGNILICTGNL